MRKPGKQLDFTLTEAGARIVPIDLSAYEAHGDTFQLNVYGQTATGRYVRIEATIPRNYVRNLASSLWNVIFAEEAKAASKRRAMQENK